MPQATVEREKSGSIEFSKEPATALEKVLYTAKVHTTGGRDGAAAQFGWSPRHKALISGRVGQRHQSGAVVGRRLVGLFPQRHGACGRQNEDRPAGRPGG